MYNMAIEDYSKAIELNPEDAVNYYYRGHAYFYSDRHNKRKARRALSDFNMAIKLNPRYEDAYVSKGYIYNSIGKYSKAIENNEKALDLNPDNAVAKRFRRIYLINSKSIKNRDWNFSTYGDLGEVTRRKGEQQALNFSQD